MNMSKLNKLEIEKKFIEKMKKKFPHYDFSKFIYINRDTKGIIICTLLSKDGTIHGDFLRTPYQMDKKSKCPICYKNERKIIEGKTTEQYIKQASVKHNGKYDYSLTIYENAKSKIEVICHEKDSNGIEHGVFVINAHSHLNGGHGCAKCTHSYPKDKELFITQSKLVHFNENYSYDKVEYKGIFKHVLIGCNKLYQENDFYDISFIAGSSHGYWKTTPDNHLRGRKCPVCSKIEKNKKRQKNQEAFINQLKIVHPFYDFSKVVYSGDQNKVIVKCENPNHDWFKITPNNLLRGHGCKKCTKQISKFESMWLDSLGIPAECRQCSLKINNKRIYADAYDSNTNTIYEFYGDYWHGNPKKYLSSDINQSNKMTFEKCYQKTLEKEKLILEAGFNLVTMWESDFIKINNEGN